MHAEIPIWLTMHERAVILSLACAQFDTINLARLRKTNASSLERTCGCYTNAIDALKVGDKETIALKPGQSFVKQPQHVRRITNLCEQNLADLF